MKSRRVKLAKRTGASGDPFRRSHRGAEPPLAKGENAPCCEDNGLTPNRRIAYGPNKPVLSSELGRVLISYRNELIVQPSVQALPKSAEISSKGYVPTRYRR